jgi:UrcA family protein
MKSTHPLRIIGISRGLAIGLVGSLCTLTAQAGARNAADQEVRHVTVRYSDLDLSAPDGMKVLYARLRGAAQSVCGYTTSTPEIRQQIAYHECFDHALDDAVRGIGNPDLQALHTQRTSKARAS